MIPPSIKLKNPFSKMTISRNNKKSRMLNRARKIKRVRNIPTKICSIKESMKNKMMMINNYHQLWKKKGPKISSSKHSKSKRKRKVLKVNKMMANCSLLKVN